LLMMPPVEPTTKFESLLKHIVEQSVDGSESEKIDGMIRLSPISAKGQLLNFICAQVRAVANCTADVQNAACVIQLEYFGSCF